ncbi:DNA binding domain-containing protein, excisionase family [Arthrobacter subterraneus]|uniref:DNA binding domain-containing protein, excisionase family n=2 Tax=Arthrobacter subterraneus TaxID=335973 RepID=A0A1G8BRJ2_9MICC|nr:DNA binding domain-containing protein, excisionase family [Arthrobacter subterraneus]
MVEERILAWIGRKTAFMAEKRFMTLADVGEVLNISSSQTYALVRSGELPAIQVGGRGQWRVETQVLEDYIARAYQKTAASVRDGLHAEHDA